MKNELKKAILEYADVRKRLDEKTCITLIDSLCDTYGTEAVAKMYIKYIKD